MVFETRAMSWSFAAFRSRDVLNQYPWPARIGIGASGPAGWQWCAILKVNSPPEHDLGQLIANGPGCGIVEQIFHLMGVLGQIVKLAPILPLPQGHAVAIRDDSPHSLRAIEPRHQALAVFFDNHSGRRIGAEQIAALQSVERLDTCACKDRGRDIDGGRQAMINGSVCGVLRVMLDEGEADNFLIMQQ